MAAAVPSPRAARPARLVVAGGVRADRHRDRRRGERGGDGAGCCSAPLLLALYERGRAASRGGRCGGFAGAPASRRWLATLWWVVPLLVAVALRRRLPALHRAAGDDLERRRACRESLRLMGYWISLPRRRLRRAPAAVLRRRRRAAVRAAGRARAALLVPGARADGLRLDAALALRAVLPAARPGRAARHGRRASRRGRRCAAGVTFTYNHFPASSSCARRTRPGRWSRSAWRCWAGSRPARLSSGCARAGARARLGAGRRARCVAFVAAWPLTTRARRRATSCAWKRIPAAWHAAAADLDASGPRRPRAIVLPGQLFAFYDWGGTVDAILPALADAPVAARYVVPLRRPARGRPAVDGRRRSSSSAARCPGQLRPLLGPDGRGAPGRRRRRRPRAQRRRPRRPTRVDVLRRGAASRRPERGATGHRRPRRAARARSRATRRAPRGPRKRPATARARAGAAARPRRRSSTAARAALAALAAFGGAAAGTRRSLYAADRSPEQMRGDARRRGRRS